MILTIVEVLGTSVTGVTVGTETFVLIVDLVENANAMLTGATMVLFAGRTVVAFRPNCLY